MYWQGIKRDRVGVLVCPLNIGIEIIWTWQINIWITASRVVKLILAYLSFIIWFISWLEYWWSWTEGELISRF